MKIVPSKSTVTYQICFSKSNVYFPGRHSSFCSLRSIFRLRILLRLKTFYMQGGAVLSVQEISMATWFYKFDLLRHEELIILEIKFIFIHFYYLYSFLDMPRTFFKKNYYHTFQPNMDAKNVKHFSLVIWFIDFY